MKRPQYRLKTALRVFGYQVAFGFIGFMILPSLLDASFWLRLPIVGSVVVLACMLLFMDGGFQGQKDMANTKTLERLMRAGAYQPTQQELSQSFHRLRGALTGMAGALPVFLCALAVAITAKPFAYTLQDLPGWLATYWQRTEISNPLLYLDGITPQATVVDYVRMVVRFCMFPFIGIFSADTDAQSLRFDRIGPLLALILPAAWAIGYQMGPRRYKKEQLLVETAKRTPRKRLKQTAKKRLQGPKEGEQLI